MQHANLKCMTDRWGAKINRVTNWQTWMTKSKYSIWSIFTHVYTKYGKELNWVWHSILNLLHNNKIRKCRPLISFAEKNPEKIPLIYRYQHFAYIRMWGSKTVTKQRTNLHLRDSVTCDSGQYKLGVMTAGHLFTPTIGALSGAAIQLGGIYHNASASLSLVTT